VQAIAALEELLAMLAARTGTAGQVARENGTAPGSCPACRDAEDFARSSTDGLTAGPPTRPVMRLQTTDWAGPDRVACSTNTAARLVTAASRCRSGWLTVQQRRPERRSDGGQMILKVTRSHSHLDPDLLIYGAPLRNRTVDLLLTMETLCRLS
jgi:hypothetical protein